MKFAIRRTGHSAGTVVAVDDHNRTIDLKRGTASQVPHPTALVPFDIVGSTVLSDSLFRLASYVAEHGIAGAGQFQPARELLLRQRPRALGKFERTLVGEDGQLTPSCKSSRSFPRTRDFGASYPRAAGFGQDVHRGSNDRRACQSGATGRSHCREPQGDQHPAARGLQRRQTIRGSRAHDPESKRRRRMR